MNDRQYFSYGKAESSTFVRPWSSRIIVQDIKNESEEISVTIRFGL